MRALVQFLSAVGLAVGLFAAAVQAQQVDISGLPEEIQQAYNAAIAAQEADDHEAAVQYFDQVLSAFKDFPQAHFARAESLRALEDYASATASYQNALRLNPNMAKAYNGLGICFKEQQQYDAALVNLQNAAERDRRDPEIAANLGDLYLNIFGQAAQALPYLDRALEADPENAEVARNRGWAHAQLQEYKAAIEDLNKAAELDPSDHVTYERLALVHLAEQDFEPAIGALGKAIETYEPEESLDPEVNINAYLQRADARTAFAREDELTPDERAQLYQGVVEDADAVLAEFPDRFPESGRALYRKGVAMRMMSKYAEAITALTDAIQIVPPGADSGYASEAYLKRGICWFYQGQNKLARGDFREAASQSLDDPLPHLWIGYTYAEEGDYRKAIESYGEAAARSPSFSLAYANRGLAYLQLDDIEKAIDNFNEAIRAEPTEAKHFYKRGKAHELLEEWQKALDSYNLALLRNENFREAHLGAARALRALGRENLARNHEQKAEALPAE